MPPYLFNFDEKRQSSWRKVTVPQIATLSFRLQFDVRRSVSFDPISSTLGNFSLICTRKEIYVKMDLLEDSNGLQTNINANLEALRANLVAEGFQGLKQFFGPEKQKTCFGIHLFLKMLLLSQVNFSFNIFVVLEKYSWNCL